MRMALHPDPHVRPSPDQVVRELAQWGRFRLSDMAVYGGSMAWEGLNWARLLAPATSSQAPTVVAGLSERDEGEERFASESERTSVLDPSEADATRVMESGYAEDPSYVDPEATQVYPRPLPTRGVGKAEAGEGKLTYCPPSPLRPRQWEQAIFPQRMVTVRRQYPRMSSLWRNNVITSGST